MSQINNDLLKVSFAFEAVEHCPICTGKVMIPNGKIRWLEIDFWYVICPACGLKYMNPRPTRESYREFYENLFIMGVGYFFLIEGNFILEEALFN